MHVCQLEDMVGEVALGTYASWRLKVGMWLDHLLGAAVYPVC